MDTPELIVMLTKNDLTVSNASEIFEECKECKAGCWGMKEYPLPPDSMKALFARMKECGKTTFLEVVAYSEEEGLEGAGMAAECGCDVLMGTIFSDRINDFCKSHNLKYMPFVGKVSGRPSVLDGNIDDMLEEAREYISKGVFGIDLLAYRYTGDTQALCAAFKNGIQAPVCVAGSIGSYAQIDKIISINPYAFTIGSAFFDKAFGETFSQEIDAVIEYISN